MRPEVFERSTLNPKRVELLDQRGYDECSHDETPDSSVPHVDCSVHTVVGRLIISKDSQWYINFDIFICVLCLASSYYYGYLCAGRYHLMNGLVLDEFWLVFGIELVFLLHFLTQFFIEYREEGK